MSFADAYSGVLAQGDAARGRAPGAQEGATEEEDSSRSGAESLPPQEQAAVLSRSQPLRGMTAAGEHGACAGATGIPFSRTAGKAVAASGLDDNAELTAPADPDHELKLANEASRANADDWQAEARMVWSLRRINAFAPDVLAPAVGGFMKRLVQVAISERSALQKSALFCIQELFEQPKNTKSLRACGKLDGLAKVLIVASARQSNTFLQRAADRCLDAMCKVGRGKLLEGLCAFHPHLNKGVRQSALSCIVACLELNGAAPLPVKTVSALCEASAALCNDGLSRTKELARRAVQLVELHVDETVVASALAALPFKTSEAYRKIADSLPAQPHAGGAAGMAVEAVAAAASRSSHGMTAAAAAAQPATATAAAAANAKRGPSPRNVPTVAASVAASGSAMADIPDPALSLRMPSPAPTPVPFVAAAAAPAASAFAATATPVEPAPLAPASSVAGMADMSMNMSWFAPVPTPTPLPAFPSSSATAVAAAGASGTSAGSSDALIGTSRSSRRVSAVALPVRRSVNFSLVYDPTVEGDEADPDPLAGGDGDSPRLAAALHDSFYAASVTSSTSSSTSSQKTCASAAAAKASSAAPMADAPAAPIDAFAAAAVAAAAAAETPAAWPPLFPANSDTASSAGSTQSAPAQTATLAAPCAATTRDSSGTAATITSSQPARLSASGTGAARTHSFGWSGGSSGSSSSSVSSGLAASAGAAPAVSSGIAAAVASSLSRQSAGGVGNVAPARLSTSSSQGAASTSSSSTLSVRPKAGPLFVNPSAEPVTFSMPFARTQTPSPAASAPFLSPAAAAGAAGTGGGSMAVTVTASVDVVPKPSSLARSSSGHVSATGGRPGSLSATNASALQAPLGSSLGLPGASSRTSSGVARASTQGAGGFMPIPSPFSQAFAQARPVAMAEAKPFPKFASSAADADLQQQQAGKAGMTRTGYRPLPPRQPSPTPQAEQEALGALMAAFGGTGSAASSPHGSDRPSSRESSVAESAAAAVASAAAVSSAKRASPIGTKRKSLDSEEPDVTQAAASAMVDSVGAPSSSSSSSTSSNSSLGAFPRLGLLVDPSTSPLMQAMPGGSSGASFTLGMGMSSRGAVGGAGGITSPRGSQQLTAMAERIKRSRNDEDSGFMAAFSQADKDARKEEARPLVTPVATPIVDAPPALPFSRPPQIQPLPGQGAGADTAESAVPAKAPMSFGKPPKPVPLGKTVTGGNNRGSFVSASSSSGAVASAASGAATSVAGAAGPGASGKGNKAGMAARVAVGKRGSITMSKSAVLGTPQAYSQSSDGMETPGTLTALMLSRFTLPSGRDGDTTSGGAPDTGAGDDGTTPIPTLLSSASLPPSVVNLGSSFDAASRMADAAEADNTPGSMAATERQLQVLGAAAHRVISNAQADLTVDASLIASFLKAHAETAAAVRLQSQRRVELFRQLRVDMEALAFQGQVVAQ